MLNSSKEALYRQMQAVFDASLCTSIIATDLDGVITFFNKGAENLLGYTAEELVNKHTPEIIHDKDEVAARAKELSEELGYTVNGFETFVAKSKRGENEEREWTYVRKDGSRFTCLLSVTPIYNESQEIIGFLGTAVDITARKEAEKKLKESEELFRRLFEDSGDALLLIIDGKFVDCNEVTVQMLRAKNKREVLNTHPSELSPEFQEDGKRSDTKAEEMMRIAFEKGSHRFEWLHKRCDGEVFPVEVLLTAITYKNKRVLHTCWRDITDRKEAEEKLRQSQKMEVIGQLAGGVAHDFNNMLSGILGAADMLEEELKSNPALLDLVEIISQSAEKAADLTKKLLTFARKGAQDFSTFNVHNSIHYVQHILEHTIDKSIQIHMKLTASKATIRGDRSQIENGLMNLGVNARDAMQNGGTLLFSTKNVSFSKPQNFHSGFELSPGEYLEITVSDSGTGIPKKMLSKIFDPFFTTKEQGKGTGLGLASVYGMLKVHEAGVKVTTSPGTGTMFQLYFPLNEEPAEEMKDSGTSANMRKKGTILIVDDEDLIRLILQKMLEQMGFTVIAASDGSECIDIFREEQDSIDLVILDMIMPVMNGSDCYRKLKEIKSDVRALIASGYTREESMEKLRSEGVLGFLEKPFRKKELVQSINEVLEQ